MARRAEAPIALAAAQRSKLGGSRRGARMSSVVYLGDLEGDSVLLEGDVDRGKVRHSLRIYRDSSRGKTIGIGKIWGQASVLQHAPAGHSTRLQFESGEIITVFVQRKSAREGYACIGVDGAVPGFQAD